MNRASGTAVNNRRGLKRLVRRLERKTNMKNIDLHIGEDRHDILYAVALDGSLPRPKRAEAARHITEIFHGLFFAV